MSTARPARPGDGRQLPLSESLTRARRLVSPRVGVISSVDYLELAPDDPSVYVAESIPTDTSLLAGQRARNGGLAASVESDRAIMKAVGETVERYCAAFCDLGSLIQSPFDALDEPAVDPGRFALFSQRQYADPSFPFAAATRTTPLRWVRGYSVTMDRPVLVPATMVHIPFPGDLGEPVVDGLISTGLACAPTLAEAMVSGALECAERDAFSIVWHNRIRCPHIDLSCVGDPLIEELLDALEGTGMDCQAVLLTQDVSLPVVLVLLSSQNGAPPLTVVGLGAALSPSRALLLAMEEACLGLYGMRRLIVRRADDPPRPPACSDVETLHEHGLVHALAPELQPSVAFLRRPEATLPLASVPDASTGSSVEDVRTVVDRLAEQGLELISVDLTTPDVDEVGFKVVRAVVPGMQPLDVNHRYRHLGGRRLYEVPVRVGAAERPPREDDLNPDPHPFP